MKSLVPPCYSLALMPRKILVADDSSMNCIMMRQTLKSIDPKCKVKVVTTAEEALKIYKSYDTIILDEDFGPDHMKGSEAISVILSDDEHPCVVVSWTSDACDKAHFMWAKHEQSDRISSDLFGTSQMQWQASKS